MAETAAVKSSTDSKMRHRPAPLVWRWMAAVIALTAGMLLLCGVAAQTDWLPQFVDFARSLPFVGSERVAAMENFYYTVQDEWSRFAYDTTHAPVVVLEEEGKSSAVNGALEPGTPTRPAVTATRGPTPGAAHGAPQGLSQGKASRSETRIPITPTTAFSTPSPMEPIILSDVQAGEGMWTTSGMPLGDQPNPPLRRTFYRPDPERPYARVELVWINTDQTRLTLVPGTREPRPIDKIPGQGQIPIALQTSGRLLAAWNGGFLTIHGAYGMMVDRRVILPPRDGFATLAFYADGTLRLGVWGRDITMTEDLVSFRENGPILIDDGAVNQDALLAWGKSVSGETRIWRSGIGLTKDGRIIYAAGNALSAQTLGEALRRAGAMQAMQLDVNAWHVNFFTYSLSSDAERLVSTKLTPAMSGGPQTYLRPHDRDFMYLTRK